MRRLSAGGHVEVGVAHKDHVAEDHVAGVDSREDQKREQIARRLADDGVAQKVDFGHHQEGEREYVIPLIVGCLQSDLEGRREDAVEHEDHCLDEDDGEDVDAAPALDVGVQLVISLHNVLLLAPVHP